MKYCLSLSLSVGVSRPLSPSVGVAPPPSVCACALLLSTSVLCVAVRTPLDSAEVSPSGKLGSALKHAPDCSLLCPRSSGSALRVSAAAGAPFRSLGPVERRGSPIGLLFLTAASAQSFTIRAWSRCSDPGSEAWGPGSEAWGPGSESEGSPVL